MCVTSVAGSPFLESPQNASVPIGKNATFICSTMMGDNINWIIVINGTPFDPHSVVGDLHALHQRGIIIDPDVPFFSSTRTLTVLATKENNQTQVTCRSLLRGEISREATLTVIGKSKLVSCCKELLAWSYHKFWNSGFNPKIF